MNIVITNAYCHLNKGDAGIIRAMIAGIRRMYPRAVISIVSLFSVMDQGKYGKGVFVLPPTMPMSSGRLGVILNPFMFIIYSMRTVLGFYGVAADAIRRADMVVSCGGGFLQAVTFYQFLLNMIYHVHQLYTCIQLHKRYVIFAQTIGKYGFGTRHIMRYILNHAALILPREAMSLNYLREIGVRNKGQIHLTADVAFLLNKDMRHAIVLDRKKRRVGITFRRWSYPETFNISQKIQKMESYVMASAEFLRKLCDDGFQVYIMPQCIGPHADNDLIVSRNIWARTGCPKVRIIDNDLPPEQLKGLYSEMDYFIGTRMHSVIFALSEHVPCIAVSYDQKTDGIMKQFNLSDLVIPIGSISYKLYVESFDRLLMNRVRYTQQIGKMIYTIRREAESNYQYLKACIHDEG